MKEVLQQQYKITFTLYINQLILLNTFSFLSLQFSLFMDSISVSFDLLERCTTLNLSLLRFCFCDFLDGENTGLRDKAKFSLQKIFIALQ